MKTLTTKKSPASGIARIVKTMRAIVSFSGIIIMGAMTTPNARAADNSWATTASGTWSTSSNWTGGSIVPGNATSGATATADVATFNTSGTKTITLDAGRTIGGISYNGAGTTYIGTSSTTDNLYLSSGGILQTTAGGGALNYNTKLIISGANATYTIRNSSSNAGGSIQLNGTISGSTSGATALTLDGSNANTFNRLNGGINNGSSTSLAVVKNGTGFWALRASNNFSGGLTLNAGTLFFNNANAFGTGAFTINGGSIDGAVTNARSNTQNWNGNFTFAGSGNLDLGPGAVTLNATRTVTTTTNTLTVGGTIGDGGNAFGLIKAGTGTLALRGNSTYTGTTTVGAGTLWFGPRASLYNGSTGSWTAANLVVNSGATAVFNVGGTGEFTSSDIDLLKSLGTSSGGFKTGSSLGLDTSNASGGTFLYSSALANPNGGANVLSLVKSGTNALVLGGANTYSGGTTINGGTLAINHVSALGSGALVINGGSLDNTSGTPVTLTTNNSQSWNGNFTFAGTNDLNLGTGAVDLNASRTVAVQTSTLTVGGVVSGAGCGLNLAGGGTLVLANANTFTGPTVINGGVLAAGFLADGSSPASVGASSGDAANLVIDGGTLRYIGTTTSTDRAFTLGAASGTIDASGSGPIAFTNAGPLILSGAATPRTLTLTGSNTGANTLAAVIADNDSGSTSLIKSGSGTWVLSGANTYSGDTTVTGGTLAIGASGSLGSGNLNLVGGNLALGNTSALSDQATLTFSPSSGAGSINLNFSGAKPIAAVTNGTAYAVAGTYTAAQLNTFFGTSAFTGTGSFTVGSWFPVPLGGGGFVTGLVSDPTGTDIYARTDVGGAFRWVPSTGGNGSWSSITDTIVPTTTDKPTTLLFTSSLAVDPSNPDNLFVAVGAPGYAASSGIFESSDHGTSWTRINPANDIVMDGNGAFRSSGERLAVDPNNPNILWFGSTQSGLYKGMKSGATWNWTQIPAASVPFGQVPANSDYAGVTFVACDPNGGSTIVYAGVYDSVGSTGGVYVSTDLGDHWTLVAGAAVSRPARGQVAPDGSLYVTGYNVVARLARGGSLAPITPNTSGVNYRGLAIDPNDATGRTAYVAEGDGSKQKNRIWRTTAAGASWTTQFENFNSDGTIGRTEPDGTPCVTGYWFGNISSLLVNPADSNELFAADYFGVARTQNATLLGNSTASTEPTWYTLQKNLEETVPEAIKNAPNGAELMTGLADVGGFRYNDITQRPSGAAGNKFTMPSTANTNSLDFCETSNQIWVRAWTGTVDNGAGGFYGTGSRSYDGGASWRLFGEIDHKIVSGAPGWVTFDLATYLISEKAKGHNIVTIMVSADRTAAGTGILQSFASKENATVANRPSLLVNGTSSLPPTDDAMVYANYPTQNYYGTGNLDVNCNGASDTWYRHSYLKFNLSGVTTINSAILRLYRTSNTATEVPVGVFACADVSWTQNTLIWNNRPMPYASNIGQPFYSPRYTTAAGLTIGGGRVAVSSLNPSQMVWMPFGGSTVPHFSTDGGVTWDPCEGLPVNVNKKISQSYPSYLIQQLTADRGDGSFYLQHLYGSPVAAKTVYKSTDGGAHWTAAGTPPYASGNVYRCQIAAAPVTGHVWTTDDGSSGITTSGLWRSINGATSFSRLPSITQVRVVGFGKGPAGSSYQYSTYFVGYYNGVKGAYRSDDYGATWTQLPALPSIGDVESIAGDRQVYGSVFIGIKGRGVFQTE